MEATRTRRALALTCIPAFMVALDQLVVTTTLPSIRADVGASVEELGWTLNAYVLAFGVFMLTGAVLGDRLGRRRMFAAGVLLFAASSAACALAPSGGALIAARAVQGIGAALVMPLSLALLTDAFPPQHGDRDLRRRHGVRRVERAARHRRPGPYQLPAAIAALHAEAEDPGATDWP